MLPGTIDPSIQSVSNKKNDTKKILEVTNLVTITAAALTVLLTIASILLIQGTLAGFGIQLTPFQLSVWAIPTAICAFIIHGTRLLLLDRQLGTRGK